ncbi:MAG: septation protein SpoVG [Spirochaetales bacterium]|nr:MAG: septation protein SpoVG [Spirochaetales bacterium]
MEITDIRIRRVDSEGKLKAYVTVTFDQCFVVHNVKVIEGRTGVFIAMPSRRTKTGEYKDVAHPINSDFRTELQARILDAYHKEGGAVDGEYDTGGRDDEALETALSDE